MVMVAPSILSADLGRLAEEIASIDRGGADMVHIDVMDGRFVPNLTFGAPVVRKVRGATSLPFDCHLMVADPAILVPAFADAGADYVTVHAELPGAGACLDLIRESGMKRGVSINPPTRLSAALPFFDDIDILLVMSVNPGYAGQGFMPEVLPKVTEARHIRGERGLGFIISVDGGIGPGTVGQAAAAGADMVVAGSAVFGKGDVAAAIRAIKEAAAGAE
ncbi:MAG: ribulose-phosphate 3-epimerase [Thermoplasmata archaeon]|nr:ribulose-phosphate 3-epimerase [Thermoplasmata archaeon]